MKKAALNDALIRSLESRISEATASIKDLEASRDTNGKSTAGDKHETGRAMAQIELENQSKTLKELQLKHAELIQIGKLEKSSTINRGSLFKAGEQWIYIAIGIGKFNFDGVEVWVVSPTSPLAQLVLRKTLGDSVLIGGKQASISEIQ